MERRQLRVWLQSPAHNRRSEVLALFEILAKAASGKQAWPTREAAFATVMDADVPYQDLRLRQWTTYLNEATEAWLVHPAPAGAGAESLLAAYRERQLGRHFEWTYTKALTALERQTYRHPEYHWDRYRLSEERYRWDAQRGRSAELDLAGQEVWLHTALLSTKLRQAALSLAYAQVSGTPVPIPMLGTTLVEASRPPYSDIIAIRLYRLTVQLYQEEEAGGVFERFADELRQHYPVFPTSEARDLLLLGINFGIRRINQGQQNYLRSTLSLYQQGLEQGVLLESERLDVYAYNNIAGIALRLGELDWADGFINEYGQRLSGSHRRTFFQLNVARLAYARQAYEQALVALAQAQTRDFVLQLTARILELKIYVDQYDYDMALQHIRNADAFLQRRQDSGYHAQNYRHILRLTEAYCRLKPFENDKHTQLRQRIQATQPLTEREWLLDLLES